MRDLHCGLSVDTTYGAAEVVGYDGAALGVGLTPFAAKRADEAAVNAVGKRWVLLGDAPGGDVWPFTKPLSRPVG